VDKLGNFKKLKKLTLHGNEIEKEKVILKWYNLLIQHDQGFNHSSAVLKKFLKKFAKYQPLNVYCSVEESKWGYYLGPS
jgi:hypothetical protein